MVAAKETTHWKWLLKVFSARARGSGQRRQPPIERPWLRRWVARFSVTPASGAISTQRWRARASSASEKVSAASRPTRAARISRVSGPSGETAVIVARFRPRAVSLSARANVCGRVSVATPIRQPSRRRPGVSRVKLRPSRARVTA